MAKPLLFLFMLLFELGQAQEMNGFDLTDALIPAAEIFKGGPPRDGIPSIDYPVFVNASQSSFTEDSKVLGVYYNGVAKAFPIAILNWHEIVNDDFGGEPVSVTYCPLCGSGMAYYTKINGARTELGVSGLLYNSDVLLYDRNTNSLWSQILNKAVTGKMKGTNLTMINTQRSTLGAWKKLYPETQVLSKNTGFQRDYDRTPYAGYDQSSSLYFPVAKKSTILHEKEWVIGIQINGKYKAYPVSKLAEKNPRKLVDEIGKEEITITWDENAENIQIINSTGEDIIGIQLFWFAWYAFHQDTGVWNLD